MDPVAETRFHYQGVPVVIKIFKPGLAFANGDQYSCAFSIKGGEIDYAGKAIGFDSAQALILALSKIGDYLENNDLIQADNIEWPGGPMRFPSFH